MEKIDAFCHVMPPAYYKRFFELDDVPAAANLRNRVAGIPSLHDMDVRFRMMDEFGDYRQIINIAAPPAEDLGSPAVTREMARIGNESMAELVAKHPDRFAGFMACVSLDDPERAVEEAEYAIGQLGAHGVQIYTSMQGHPMDEERFEPFWASMAASNKVIQVHPCRNSSWPDYPTETQSKFEMWWALGWEMDLSVFMGRMVFSGVLERYPDIKFLIHHGGSMISHFSGRVGPGLDQLGERTPPAQKANVEHYPLSKRPLDYFKMFYVDTAMFGAAHALRCSIDFFGVDHVMFGSDCPYDPEKGPGYIRATIGNLQEIGLDDTAVGDIFNANVRRVFGADFTRP